MKDRKRNRLDSFHYTSGYFFVTINVKNHQKVFGEIVGEEMILNKYGKVVEEIWLKIPKIHKNVLLLDFIIMPNHLHGIIVIEDDNVGAITNRPYNKVGNVIKGFKQISTKILRYKFGLKNFQRQKSFYDHIIRNEEDMNRIVEYIQRNPYKRENDEYYVK